MRNTLSETIETNRKNDRWQRPAVLLLFGLVIALVLTKGNDIALSTLFHYLFCLRVPILVGFLLLTLPVISVSIASNLLKNLFVLRNQGQVRLVTFAAIFAGMGVVTVLNTLLLGAPVRFSLSGLSPMALPWRYGIAIGLAIPTLVTIAVLSKGEIDAVLEKHSRNHSQTATQELFGGVVSGGLLAVVGLAIGDFVTQQTEFVIRLKPVLMDIVDRLPAVIRPSHIFVDQTFSSHLSAVGFFIFTLCIYFLSFLWSYRIYQAKPEQLLSKKDPFEVPALFYLLIIILLLVIFLGGLTFLLDHYWIPTLPLLLFFSALNYWLFKVNHFYQLKPLQSPIVTKTSFKDFLAKRLENQPQDNRSLVVVCAAGGGIQASGWTAQVLTGLHDHRSLGQEFTDAIGLISSVSGGSVGAMYFLDSFKNRVPQNSQQTVEKAMHDGLDAVGWGLAYPDLWRIIGLPFLALLGARKIDRGTALETDWRRALTHPTASFATWLQQINNGILPISVLNATVVESGSRFLISPVSFKREETTFSTAPESTDQANSSNSSGSNNLDNSNPDNVDTRFRDFRADFEEFDINVATAARLSATFPYVSPVCRPAVLSSLSELWSRGAGYFSGKAAKVKAHVLKNDYHVADGGYFENNGVFTAIEWLDKCVLPAHKALGLKRVFLIEILPFPKAEANSNQTLATKQNGWIMTTLGPLFAAYLVRNYTLTARNTADIGDLKKFWQKTANLEIEHFVLQFPKDLKPSGLPSISTLEQKNVQKVVNSLYVNGTYAPPLSWKLTELQKQAIRYAWDKLVKDAKQGSLDKHENGLAALVEKWNERHSQSYS